MTIKEHNNQLDQISELVDNHGVPHVLDLLAQVLSAKADNLREENEGPIADNYDKMTAIVLECEERITIMKG